MNRALTGNAKCTIIFPRPRCHHGRLKRETEKTHSCYTHNQQRITILLCKEGKDLQNQPELP